MLLYFILINQVALPPLNNLRAHGPQWRSTLVGVLPGVLVLVALARGSELAVLLAASWLSVWLALQSGSGGFRVCLAAPLFIATSAGMPREVMTGQRGFCRQPHIGQRQTCSIWCSRR